MISGIKRRSRRKEIRMGLIGDWGLGVNGLNEANGGGFGGFFIGASGFGLSVVVRVVRGAVARGYLARIGQAYCINAAQKYNKKAN